MSWKENQGCPNMEMKPKGFISLESWACNLVHTSPSQDNENAGIWADIVRKPSLACGTEQCKIKQMWLKYFIKGKFSLI